MYVLVHGSEIGEFDRAVERKCHDPVGVVMKIGAMIVRLAIHLQTRAVRQFLVLRFSH